MVHELETEWVHLAPETPTTRGWQLFFRHCRSAAAREIQVATGLPITPCQRRVWLTACEPERVGPVRDAMRLGRVTLARALTLVEATAHLHAFTAAAIATRVLRPMTGPDGLPLPGVAPLSQATFTARLHRQLVLHHGLVGAAERTYEQAVRGRRVSREPNPDGTGMLLITGDGPRIEASSGGSGGHWPRSSTQTSHCPDDSTCSTKWAGHKLWHQPPHKPDNTPGPQHDPVRTSSYWRPQPPTATPHHPSDGQGRLAQGVGRSDLQPGAQVPVLRAVNPYLGDNETIRGLPHDCAQVPLG